MTKIELIKMLEDYPDNVLVYVECGEVTNRRASLQ